MPDSASSAVPFFDTAHLNALLGADAARFSIEQVEECASTNSELLTRAKRDEPPDSGCLLIAERQHAGRGRRGRTWLAAPGHSLTFSLLWRFPATSRLEGLSLAVGLALARAMGPQIQVKWPNDLLRNGGKLAGILIEMSAPQTLVIGIGINLSLPAPLPPELPIAPAALFEQTPSAQARHELLAALLRELRAALDCFAERGWAPFRDEWQQRHAFHDQPVRIFDATERESFGICRGVDAQGALLLETDGVLQRLISGEISVRPA